MGVLGPIGLRVYRVSGFRDFRGSEVFGVESIRVLFEAFAGTKANLSVNPKP